MISGALPAALSCVALGLALAFAAPGVRRLALVALALSAAATSLLAPAAVSPEALLILTCLAVLLSSAIGLIARTAHIGVVGPLAAFTGAVMGLGAMPAQSFVGVLLACLIAAPSAWVARRRERVVLRIAASWLLTVALLVAATPLVTTPGYTPDHME